MLGSMATTPTPRIRFDAIQVGVAGAVTAASMFAQWATLAARYVEQVGQTIGDVGARRTSSQDAAGAVLQSYIAYVREVTVLPRASGLRFYSELARLKADAAARTSAVSKPSVNQP